MVASTLRAFRRRADQAAIDAFWFGADRDAIIRTRFDVDPLSFWPAFARHDRPERRARFTTVFDDIDALGKLHRLGIRLGIVTNAPLHIARAELALLGDAPFGAVVVADAERRIRPKPSPDGILACLDALSVRADRAWFVGNAAEDIEAARAEVRAQGNVRPAFERTADIGLLATDGEVRAYAQAHVLGSAGCAPGAAGHGRRLVHAGRAAPCTAMEPRDGSNAFPRCAGMPSTVRPGHGRLHGNWHAAC